MELPTLNAPPADLVAAAALLLLARQHPDVGEFLPAFGAANIIGGKTGIRESGEMVITLPPPLAAVLDEQARQRGLTPEALALDVLREHFHVQPADLEPRDEWERRLLALAMDCGVSLSNEALSREEMYE